MMQKANLKLVISGSRKNSQLLSVKRLPRRRAMFLSRLSPDTSVNAVTDFLSPLKLSFLVCRKLKTKFQTYASFHVEVYETDFDLLMDAKIWPEGCLVSEFFGRLRDDQIAQDHTVHSEIDIVPSELNSDK